MTEPTFEIVPFVDEVHRVARRKDVFDFRPYDSVLLNRWDDPQGTFHVIYAAETLEGAFIEFLGDFHYAKAADEALDEIDKNDDPWVETEVRSGQIDTDLVSMLYVGRLSIHAGSFAVSADHANTLCRWSRAFVTILNDLRIARLNVSSILSDCRRLTCAISRIFYEDRRTVGNIRCQSKYGSNYMNWTLYQGDQPPLDARVRGQYSICPAHVEMDALRAAMSVLQLTFAVPVAET